MQRNIFSGYEGLVMLLIVTASSCVKPFAPPATKINYEYLVVDGTIAIGTPTTFRLSHTRTLYDTASTPETNAVVSVESESGMIYPLASSGDGSYTDINTDLAFGQKYRLNIQTGAGKQYRSDFVNAKQSPEIDSLDWNQDNDIFIYLNTHDPQKNSRYYRWDFTETYEVRTPYDSYLDFQGGEVVFLEPEEYRTICYHTLNSTSTIIGTSSALNEDVISHVKITSVPNDNSKISERYSILVRQYVLTAEAYQYWSIVKQNSQQSGGIFDPQPSQLKGNIKCVSDTLEPVIGFVTAGSTSEKRIFISNNQLSDRVTPTSSDICKETFIDRSDAAMFLSDGVYLPAYYVTNGPLAIAPKFCVDCRIFGGVTTKPSYW